jgi:hypothetical protein
VRNPLGSAANFQHAPTIGIMAEMAEYEGRRIST